MVCVAPALLVGSLAFAPTLGHRAVSLRCGSALNIVAAVEPPGLSDELKPRFDRGDSETKKSFAADKPKQSVSQPTAPSTAVSNERLLAEIRALQPEPKGPRPEITKIDLNGISPAFLLFGSLCYGAVGFLGVQFTVAAADYFGAHPMDDAFYVVQRLSTVARYVVIAMGALGAGVTSIAALGQLALAGRVAIGIATGELDPTAERVDPYGGRKQSQLQRMLALMLGDQYAGQEVEDKR